MATKKLNRAEHKKLKEAAWPIYMAMLAEPAIRNDPITNYRDVALESFRRAREQLWPAGIPDADVPTKTPATVSVG